MLTTRSQTIRQSGGSRPRLPTLHTKLDANHGHDSVAPPESRGALAAWDCYHGSA
jgi:hypothetical protein